jgi:hypothetical protein
LQKLRKYNLYSRFTPEAIAQQFFDGLPPLVHYFIPYLDKSSQHVDPTIRTCYEDVQAELTAVKLFLPYIKAVKEEVKKTREHRGNLGIADGAPNGQSRIQPREGEIHKFTPLSPTSLSWLNQNAQKFKIRHSPLRNETFAVLVGPVTEAPCRSRISVQEW